MVDNLMECPAYSRYTFKDYVQLNTGKLTLHFKFPNDGYGPSCLITTNKSTYDHLSNIYKRLPKLNITRLEYAIDLYCKTPEAVNDLFYLVRRYLYRRNAQGTMMKGEKYYGWKANRKINALYFITMGKSSGKHIKVYERGDDAKKTPGSFGHPTWRHEDVDRVRIEFKLRRTAIAEKYGLSSLKDLLIDPKFADIASEYVQFKNFKFHRELSQDWEDYPAEDERGNPESFMQEVLQAKSSGIKNVNQYIIDNQRMMVLKKRIIEAAENFDNNWSKGCRRIVA